MGPRVPLPQEQRPFSVLSLGQPQGTLPEHLWGAPDGEECLGCGLPRLHCCILELALDEMCIAKCSLFTCEMGVQVAVPDGLCVQVICADFPRAYSGAPHPRPGWAPLSLIVFCSGPARSEPLWKTSGLCHLRLGEGVERCWHPEGAFAETGLRLC